MTIIIIIIKYLRTYKMPEFEKLHANRMWYDVDVRCTST